MMFRQEQVKSKWNIHLILISFPDGENLFCKHERQYDVFIFIYIMLQFN